jgi:hypothetical protein
MLAMSSSKASSMSLRAAPKLAAAQLKRRVDSGRSLTTRLLCCTNPDVSRFAHVPMHNGLFLRKMT